MARLGPVALLQITRIDSSLIAAAVIFLPMLIIGFDIQKCFVFALPMLTSSMSGFILNDIYDLEKDMINHPERPLPRKIISIRMAMILYFAFLFITLLVIATFIDLSYLYLYLLFYILITNYNYLVENFPKLKNLYVAAVSTIPILITQNIISGDFSQAGFPFAVFGFVFGRELLMDVQDSEGDGPTLAKLLGEKASTVVAFVSQLLSIIMLVSISDTSIKLFSLFLIVMVWIPSIYLWMKKYKRPKIIQFMKIQMLASMVFFF